MLKRYLEVQRSALAFSTGLAPPGSFLRPKAAARRVNQSQPTHAHTFRKLCRSGDWKSPSCNYHGAEAFIQANIVIIPQKYSFDFLRFTLLNPRPCPLLGVSEIGDPYPGKFAAESDDVDIRFDLPRYQIWENGKPVDEERYQIDDIWRDDLVTFMLGCSFSWEGDLSKNGLMTRHVEECKNVPMYRTRIRNNPSGPFAGNLVVSMRPYKIEQLDLVDQITSSYPSSHGGPIHFGNPEELGILDINKPDWGDAVTMREGEVPVFWACGVTSQTAIEASKIDFAITHSPGHMLICDTPVSAAYQ